MRSTHLRIVVPRSVLAPNLFADFYRFGAPRARAPLVSYWGGAISAEEYEACRDHLPEGVVGEVQSVLEGDPPSFDLVVFSAPPAGPRCRSQLREDLARAFVKEVLAQSPNPEPSVLGYVGYSVGGHLAISLALDVPRSRRVATLGGVGLREALIDAGDVPLDELEVLCFVNDADSTAPETEALERVFASRGWRLPVRTGPGGHDRDDYEANGFVKEAFAWVLDGIFSPWAGRFSPIPGSRCAEAGRRR